MALERLEVFIFFHRSVKDYEINYQAIVVWSYYYEREKNDVRSLYVLYEV